MDEIKKDYFVVMISTIIIDGLSGIEVRPGGLSVGFETVDEMWEFVHKIRDLKFTK